MLPMHESLGQPTIGEIRDELQARMLRGSEASLHREALDFKIAAMQLPNFLEHISEGTLVITPGDRGDVLLASLATVPSENYPPIAGVLLTGGIPPGRFDRPSDRRPEACGRSGVDGRRRYARRGGAGDEDSRRDFPRQRRKIAAALGVFEAGVNADELEQRIECCSPARRHAVDVRISID